jgi:hypothetical protein
MERDLRLTAKICAWLGVTLRILAYQNSSSPHGAPEWVYDVDSVGFLLESVWLVLLAFSNGKRMWEMIVPSVLFTYVVLFDACKEVSGINQSKTWMEQFLFWFFLLITYIISRHVRKTRSGEG